MQKRASHNLPPAVHIRWEDETYNDKDGTASLSLTYTQKTAQSVPSGIVRFLTPIFIIPALESSTTIPVSL